MSSLTSWIVEVVRRRTTRLVGALSALMIVMVIHSIWKKRAITENCDHEKEPRAETTPEVTSNNTTPRCIEELDQVKENQNQKSEQLFPEATKSPDSSTKVSHEDLFKALEVLSDFETSSRESLRTYFSMNDDALPEKRDARIPMTLTCLHSNMVSDGPVKNTNNTAVDSSKSMDIVSSCNSLLFRAVCQQNYTRLVLTIGEILKEYHTNAGRVKRSTASWNKRRGTPYEKSNLPTGWNGSSKKPETAPVGFRENYAKNKITEIWENFFNSTDELIKKMEASIEKFKTNVIEIVESNDHEESDSSEDWIYHKVRKSVREALPSNTNDTYVERQDPGYLSETSIEKFEQVGSDMTKSKDSFTKEKVFRAPEVLNGLEASLGKISRTDVSTSKFPSSDEERDEMTLDLHENLTDCCQKDQVVILKNDGANVLERFRKESDGWEVESSKFELFDGLKIHDNKDRKENQSTPNFTKTDFLTGNVDACDMLLSLTQSLPLSHVVLNDFTFYDKYINYSYYTKLLISSLTPGNSTKAITSGSNLDSEKILDKNEKVSDNGILEKLQDTCTTNKNFKNFLLGELYKAGLLLNYYAPENDTAQGTTPEYIEPEFQYFLDDTCDSGEEQRLLESSLEESYETTDEEAGSGYFKVSAYPEEVECDASISSLEGELEVLIGHEDSTVTTYRITSAEFLRYGTANSKDINESVDPFRPSFPSQKVEKECIGKGNSLKFEDSFTMNDHSLGDASEANRWAESNKLKADVGELSEDVFSAYKGSLTKNSVKLQQNAGLEGNLDLKRNEGSGPFYTGEVYYETGEKMNCLVLLEVDPESQSVKVRKLDVKGECFGSIEDRDDDDDDKKKEDEVEGNSSERKNAEDGGEEGADENGESPERPGESSGQSGGGTGSSGGGDDKKNGDGKKIKESSEDEESSDGDDEENAEGSLEKVKNIDEKKENQSVDGEKDVSRDPGHSEIETALDITSLNMEDQDKNEYKDLLAERRSQQDEPGPHITRAAFIQLSNRVLPNEIDPTLPESLQDLIKEVLSEVGRTHGTIDETIRRGIYDRCLNRVIATRGETRWLEDVSEFRRNRSMQPQLYKCTKCRRLCKCECGEANRSDESSSEDLVDPPQPVPTSTIEPIIPTKAEILHMLSNDPCMSPQLRAALAEIRQRKGNQIKDSFQIATKGKECQDTDNPGVDQQSFESPTSSDYSREPPDNSKDCAIAPCGPDGEMMASLSPEIFSDDETASRSSDDSMDLESSTVPPPRNASLSVVPPQFVPLGELPQDPHPEPEKVDEMTE